MDSLKGQRIDLPATQRFARHVLVSVAVFAFFRLLEHFSTFWKIVAALLVSAALLSGYEDTQQLRSTVWQQSKIILAQRPQKCDGGVEGGSVVRAATQ
jgi:hypothetical protein